jgi:flagellar protein FlbD
MHQVVVWTLDHAVTYVSWSAFDEGIVVIKLTRLDGEVFVLNAELIRYVEGQADTFVTLTTGERLVVRERLDEVMQRAVSYQQSKFLLPLPRLSPTRN